MNSMPDAQYILTIHNVRKPTAISSGANLKNLNRLYNEPFQIESGCPGFSVFHLLLCWHRNHAYGRYQYDLYPGVGDCLRRLLSDASGRIQNPVSRRSLEKSLSLISIVCLLN